jgi:hypothetical protein
MSLVIDALAVVIFTFLSVMPGSIGLLLATDSGRFGRGHRAEVMAGPRFNAIACFLLTAAVPAHDWSHNDGCK